MLVKGGGRGAGGKYLVGCLTDTFAVNARHPASPQINRDAGVDAHHIAQRAGLAAIQQLGKRGCILRRITTRQIAMLQIRVLSISSGAPVVI